MSTPISSASTPEALPEKPGGRHTGLIIAAIIIVLAIIASIIFAVTKNTGQDSAADGKTTVKIGTTEAANDYWNVIKKKAAAESINIEVVSFNDYTQPNVALSQGQIDLNAFQHLLFLADYDVKNNDNITALAATYIVPLNIYSKKYQRLSQLPAGATIAIPNDATNQGRALLVLQEAGLLKLRGNGSALSTPADVITNQSKVKVKAIDAAQTAASSKASMVPSSITTLPQMPDWTATRFSTKMMPPASRPIHTSTSSQSRTLTRTTRPIKRSPSCGPIPTSKMLSSNNLAAPPRSSPTTPRPI